MSLKGRGLEFDEVRPYTHGDDVRFIDWNVTARTTQPYIKRFHEERELNVVFVVDRSSSFQWTSRLRERREQVAEFCGLLGQVALRNHDRVGQFSTLKTSKTICLLPDLDINTFICFKRFSKNHKEETKNDLIATIEFIAQLKLKRSVIFVISDFIDEKEWPELEILSQLHEVVAVRIFDPFEHREPNLGLSSFTDIEKGTPLKMDVSSKVQKRILPKVHRVGLIT